MPFERSHGKARPTLPRASDLAPSETDANRSDGRGPDGKFTPGNRLSIGARFTATIRKSLGGKESKGVALVVSRDARRVFSHTLAALPSNAAPVRALLAVYARHQALHAYYSLAAEGAGLDTERGLELLDVADKQSQRAERTLVTVHDLARVHAQLANNRDGAIDVEKLNAEAEAATERRREGERKARAQGGVE